MADWLPEAGDLITDGPAGAKWVVTDIEHRGEAAAVWILRPLYGGGADGEQNRKLSRAAIDGYPVLRRRGEWVQP